MRTQPIVLLAILIAFGALDAAACVDISNSSERLECYEEALRCGAIRDDDDRLRCFDSQLTTQVGQADSTGRPAQSDTDEAHLAVPAASAHDSFGRAKQEPDRIAASIVGTFDGWEGRERFELSNGQVWEVRRIDSARSYRPVKAPKVVIRKNLLGFYVMDVLDVNVTIPVTRVN